LKSDGNFELFAHRDFRDIDRFRALVESFWTIQEYRTNGSEPPLTESGR
jgi:hypothetical protein